VDGVHSPGGTQTEYGVDRIAGDAELKVQALRLSRRGEPEKRCSKSLA
jgi:hypothetical protein